MYRTIIKHYFDSAHSLKSHKGKCFNMHGHRWDVEIAFEFEEIDTNTNMTEDFSHLKSIIYELCSDLDHKVLNEVFDEENPTAEFIARWFYYEIMAFNKGYKISYVAINETPTNRVEFYGDIKNEN